MKTSDKLKKYPKQYWLIPLVILIVPLVVEFFVRDISYQTSLGWIISLQKWMDENGLSAEKIPAVYSVLTYTTFNMFYMLMCVLVYNFLNVYKSFILVFSIYFSNYLSTFLSFIYHVPRPYMVNQLIKPYFAITEWGYPSTQIVTMVAFFATFHKVIFKSKLAKDKLALKIIIGLFFGLINLFYIFIQFAGGVISLEQIILSVFMGFVVFLTMFCIFEAKVNNAKQFHSFVHFRFLYYLAINVILASFLFLFYLFIVDEEASSIYTLHVDTQFNRLENGTIANSTNITNFKNEDPSAGNKKEPNYFQFETVDFFSLNGANFCNAICFLSNIFALIGLKFELYGTYESNFENWKKSNFENRDGQTGLKYSIYQDHQFVKGTQWNHTGGCKTFVRFFVLIILFLLGFIPAIIVQLLNGGPGVRNNKGNIFSHYLFYIAIPFFYVSFGMFFFFKFVCRKLKLTNIISSID